MPFLKTAHSYSHVVDMSTGGGAYDKKSLVSLRLYGRTRACQPSAS